MSHRRCLYVLLSFCCMGSQTMWFERSLISCFVKVVLDVYVCLSIVLFVWLAELCGSCLTDVFLSRLFCICVTA
ncbi:hypothetical protein HanRHA438_Chr17g0797541 [Helianthus annuus]|nr:hypothetical protein HanIR_Chr17g0854461 [Helianthus annuus]KAJ0824915.1 hypothetical protein HanRHA438_Chr17g0797541 [Helianthus annuus]